MTQQIEDAGTRHAEAKETELDKFAGRLGDNFSAEVTQRTLAVKTQIDEHAGEYLKCTTIVFFVKSGNLPIHVSSVKKNLKQWCQETYYEYMKACKLVDLCNLLHSICKVKI